MINNSCSSTDLPSPGPRQFDRWKASHDCWLGQIVACRTIPGITVFGIAADTMGGLHENLWTNGCIGITKICWYVNSE